MTPNEPIMSRDEHDDRTSGGVPVTDELVQRLAAEAATGYDVGALRRPGLKPSTRAPATSSDRHYAPGWMSPDLRLRRSSRDTVRDTKPGGTEWFRTSDEDQYVAAVAARGRRRRVRLALHPSGRRFEPCRAHHVRPARSRPARSPGVGHGINRGANEYYDRPMSAAGSRRRRARGSIETCRAGLCVLRCTPASTR